jgi:transcription elongation factor Elf1
MSTYIDIKYLNLLSTRLPKFKRKSEYLFNFRCPHCGDSQKSQTKARGFVYQKKNDMFFKCHNCGVGQTLGNLIKFVDPSMHKEYIFERFKEGKVVAKKEEPEFDFTPSRLLKSKEKPFAEFTRYDRALRQLRRFDELVQTHPAKQFVFDRQIPKEHFDKFFLATKFYEFCNEIQPGKFPDLKHDHPRVVIPFYDRAGKFFAFQGRAFGKEQPKYITIKFDETKQKIYGLDRIDLNKPVMITEGPIDSLFLDNAIAMAGADADGGITIQHQQCTMIFDNEPRNEHIVSRMIRAVDKNFNVCIWPESVREGKDINDLILSGKSASQVQSLIHNNTHSGLAALQNINNWKRI